MGCVESKAGDDNKVPLPREGWGESSGRQADAQAGPNRNLGETVSGTGVWAAEEGPGSSNGGQPTLRPPGDVPEGTLGEADAWGLLVADVDENRAAFQAQFDQLGSLGGAGQQRGGGGDRDPLQTLISEHLHSWDHFEVLEVLGQGAYGMAVKARWSLTDEIVVVKQVRVEAMEEKEREEARKEVTVLQMLDHPNCVKYRTSFVEGGTLYIVMEYASRGDLYEIIQTAAKEGRSISEQDIMYYFVQMCLALHHVHQKGILHRDLKTQNVFVSDHDMIKLGDFGIAKMMGEKSMANTIVGTPYFLSPEICEGRAYNQKSDVWSLGCVLYELATLKHAFDGSSLPAVVMKIIRGTYSPLPAMYSASLRELVSALLQRQPLNRPTIKQLLTHPFVRPHLERYCSQVLHKVLDDELAYTQSLQEAGVGPGGFQGDLGDTALWEAGSNLEQHEHQRMERVRAAKEEKQQRQEQLAMRKYDIQRAEQELQDRNYLNRMRKREAKLAKERLKQQQMEEVNRKRSEEREAAKRKAQEQEEKRKEIQQKRAEEYARRRAEEVETKKAEREAQRRRLEEHKERLQNVERTRTNELGSLSARKMAEASAHSSPARTSTPPLGAACNRPASLPSSSSRCVGSESPSRPRSGRKGWNAERQRSSLSFREGMLEVLAQVDNLHGGQLGNNPEDTPPQVVRRDAKGKQQKDNLARLTRLTTDGGEGAEAAEQNGAQVAQSVESLSHYKSALYDNDGDEEQDMEEELGAAPPAASEESVAEWEQRKHALKTNSLKERIEAELGTNKFREIYNFLVRFQDADDNDNLLHEMQANLEDLLSKSKLHFAAQINMLIGMERETSGPTHGAASTRPR